MRLEDHDQKLFAKWKAAGLGLDGVNNSPRKEIAAYLVQKLVVDPEAYVVPPSVARCVPTSDFPDPKGHKITRLSGAQCELGVFSVWLQNVTLPDVLFDSERFARDPVYARHMATFNLVTYLLYHQDGRRGNFLVSKNDADRRVFAIDNGVAFSGVFYNWFVPNWKAIRVPALPPEGVERLRRIGKGDLDHLAVVAQLERGEDGIFRSVPHTAPIDEDDGARVEGGVVQFGLTDDEIEDLYERIEELLEDVDEGEIGLLPPASR